MVFGELLGGMAVRAGERFDENTQRQRKIEDWQRSQRLGMWTDMIRQNWDNMQADQQEAVIGQMAPDLGIKPKDAMSMITAAKGIHKLIPQIQAVPESLGPSGRQGTVTATPSTEPAARGIQAPATPQFSALPQPADILSPSIMAPTTGGMASAPGMTPNQIKAQQKFEQDKAIRQQRTAEIRAAGLPPDLEMAALGKQVGDINAVPVITSQIGADARRDVAQSNIAAKDARIQGSPRFVIRGGEQIPIYRRGLNETYFDPQLGVESQYRFMPGDKVYEKSATTGGIQLIQDDRGTYAVNKAGAMSGAPGSVAKVPGVGGRPQPQSQLTTITTPDSPTPKIATFTPGRGGGGTIKIVGEGVKGTVPALPTSTQDEIIGLGSVSNTMGRLQELLPQIANGPVWGRLRSVQLGKLGGWGSTPEEVQVATQLQMLLRSAFDTAGKNFTKNERDIFEGIYPGPNDTLETALIKIPESMRYVQERMQMRKGVMSPMQRSQTQFPDVSGKKAELSVTAPNGKVYTFPNKEAADRFRTATGAK